jgi:hypothetical protein
MVKVDATALKLPELGWAPDPTRHHITRAPYNREPYVRASVDGVSVDAKAIGWTREHVQLKWQADGETYTRWVFAKDVVRIGRDESRWRDPYDERD